MKKETIDNLVNLIYPNGASATPSRTLLIPNASQSMVELGVFTKQSPSAKLFATLTKEYQNLRGQITKLNKSNSMNLDDHLRDVTDAYSSFSEAARQYKEGIKQVDIKSLSVQLETLCGQLDTKMSEIDLEMTNFRSLSREDIEVCVTGNDRIAMSDKLTNSDEKLSIESSSELGDKIIGMMGTHDSSALRDNVNALAQKDRDTWTELDTVLARCLACSKMPLTSLEADLKPFINELRKDYDLTFPNNSEYEANRKNFLKEMTKDHDLTAELAPLGSKINIIMCREHSKADVITATEQYIRKLTLSAERKHAPLRFKVVKNDQELQDALTYCNAQNVSVHLTSISHGSDGSLGYCDLSDDIKRAALLYVKGEESKLDLLARLTSIDEFIIPMILEEIKQQPKVPSSTQSIEGKFLDALRNMSGQLVQEQEAIAKLINENSSIKRVRLLACTSGGTSDLMSYQSTELSDNGEYGERRVNRLLVLSDDPRASKIESIAQKVTREGVIIKGELGIINPGVGGKLRYGSKQIQGGKLYENDASSQLSPQGSIRFITKNKGTAEDISSEIDTMEKYKSYKERIHHIIQVGEDQQENDDEDRFSPS